MLLGCGLVTWALAGPLDDGRALHETGRHAHAVVALQDHLASHPDDALALALYVEAREALGEGDVVVAELGRRPTRPAQATLPERIRGSDMDGLTATLNTPGGLLALAEPLARAPDRGKVKKLREVALDTAGRLADGDLGELWSALAMFRAVNAHEQVTDGELRLRSLLPRPEEGVDPANRPALAARAVARRALERGEGDADILAMLTDAVTRELEGRCDLTGMVFPLAYERCYRERRAHLGQLDSLRAALDGRLGTTTPPAPQLSVLPDAAHLVARAEDAGVRTRWFLVEAVRRGGAGAEEARRALDGVWFPSGLDGHVAAWDAVLPGPTALIAPRRQSAVREPDPDPEGVFALASRSGACTGCALFGAELEAAAVGIPRGLDIRRVDTDVRWPWLVVFGPDGERVARVEGPATRDQLRQALWEGVAARRELDGRGGPRPVAQAPAAYPQSARWLGSPGAECLARALVDDRGGVRHAVVEECGEPFVKATRDSLARWSFQPRTGVALVRVRFDPPLGSVVPSLAPGACFWSSTVAWEGHHEDVATSCEPGWVIPGPIPWSAVAVADTDRVGSFTIRNARLPVACDVVVEVDASGVSTALDPGACPDVVRSDVVAAVRGWAWAHGPEDPPTRLILHFVPPAL